MSLSFKNISSNSKEHWIQKGFEFFFASENILKESEFLFFPPWRVYWYSGTSVLVIHICWNSWQVPKPMRNDEAFSLCGSASWLIQIVASVTCPKQVPHVLKHFFLIKIWRVQGLMSSEAEAYWGMSVWPAFALHTRLILRQCITVIHWSFMVPS